MNVRRYLSSLVRMALCNSIVYKVYEKILWNQIKDGAKPEHIGIILDGNRRWASENAMPAWMGHHIGADKIEELLNWYLELDGKAVTLYVFSTENFGRSRKEVDEIMKLAREKLVKVLNDEQIHKNRVRIKAIGRLDLLPEDVRDLIERAEEATKDYDGRYLNVAIAYGGRAEIVDATRKIAEEVLAGKLAPSEIDEGVVEDHLYTAHLPKPDPDLIVRTSGEERLSGFLLWQGAYSELVFLDVYWPDFRKIDLWRAIRTYQRRDRRYGH
ncbi:MAG: polyprenyl diphosphate synthase [Candidatus Bathyarchaeia archaeon]